MLHLPRRMLGIVSSACAIGAAALVALPASSAQASLLGFVSLNSCDNSALTQPFQPWLDNDYYKLAPGADFESGLSGWTLNNGAGQVAGSESYGVTGSVGAYSLGLPAGSSAVSPTTCVNAAYPTFRFFTRSDTPGSLLSVSVVYGGVTIPVGLVSPTSSWQPTPPMTTLSAIPGLLNGGTANVELQFTEVSGSAQVDDAYVDPWGNH